MGNQAMLEAALAYVAEGFKVFPLKPKDKIPITPHGLKDATQLQIGVKEYWGRNPYSNIGLVCNNLIVIEFDAGHNGLESKAVLIAKYGEFPRTRVHKSGGGGEHWLYKAPANINVRPGAGGYGYPGVDIRANDSYIVVPPSIHPNGNRYEIIDDSPLAEAPGWLIELANTKIRRPTCATASQEQPVPLMEGNRNSQLTSLAGTMRRRGMTQTEIEAALVTINKERCQPPLDESEVSRIAGSVSHYAPMTTIPLTKPVPEQHQNNHHKPELKYLDSVKAQEVQSLWYPYIPIGKLTLLEGDPGVGKSWVMLAIATAVSCGHGLPPAFGPNEIGYTLIASAEDGLADTIKPRLTLMQAEAASICAIDGLFTLDDTGFEMLEDWIKQVQPILVIIDPLVAYLSSEMDINKANQVRYATARLARLAEKYNLAMVAVRHLTKGSSLKPLYRGLGSIDFTASARSVLLAGNDPDDPETRGIVHIKSNLSPKGDPIGFKITRERAFEWLASSTLTADQILAAGEGDTSALNVAKAFLMDALGGGAQPARDIYTEADNQGISKATLNRAKLDLKVVSYNQAEPGKRGAGKWYMKLPGSD